ncbi:hypothetical protein LGM58_11175 [Burkholderia contaminans]|uniref:hypothetical protein n=1 Tax=Burkholderia contaminans TaxID=488447 RepID=UPI001CF146DC|nr:hypothetical protein [Burkholderia contaminans]ELK6464157.1 hypothetical protein [Burkholderia contaminans]MCA7883752.1 hypothetical protein [Burkholderia contaminans]
MNVSDARPRPSRRTMFVDRRPAPGRTAARLSRTADSADQSGKRFSKDRACAGALSVGDFDESSQKWSRQKRRLFHYMALTVFPGFS